MLLSALGTLGKSLLSGRKKKKSKSGKEMSQQVLNRSNNEDEKPTIKPQNSLVPLSIKTTTIPTANLITTKEDSVKDKLLMIKDLLGLQLKFRLSSWSQRMESMKEERRKNREKQLEESKEKKKKSSFLNLLPKTGILDSLKNFLAFLGGGILLNLLLQYLPVLEEIGKKLAPIAKGVMQFGKFMWEGVVGFIVAAYDEYDELRKSIEKIGGEEALEKFDMVSNLLKKVINGALIMAAVALVARPFMKPGGGDGKGPGGGTLICNCPLVPVTVPQLVSVTLTTLQTIIAGSLIPGAAELLKKLLEGLIGGGRVIADVPDDQPITGPVVEPEPVIDWGVLATSPKLLYEFVKANSGQLLLDPVMVSTLIAAGVITQLDGPLLPFGDIAGFKLASASLILKLQALNKARLLVIPAAAALLSQQGATAAEVDKNVPNYTVMGIEYDGNTGLPVDKTTTEKTIKTQKFIPLGKNIIQWYDVEDEPNFIKDLTSGDDIAMDTSYSKSSYGMINNTTTIIQPVVKEV